MLGCGGGKGRCGERCREVCWGVGEVKGDVGFVGVEVWGSVLGCGGGKGRCGKCWGRCGKVCWGVGEVKGDVGKCGGRH